MIFLLNEIQEFLNKALPNWSKLQKVDNDYKLMSKITDDFKMVGIYKVGMMGGNEPTWNFTIGIEPTELNFILHFYLNDVESPIMDSLNQSGFKSTPHYFFKIYKIELNDFNQVKEFLNKHVFCYDPGYFY